MEKLRKQRYTMREIGERFGVSHQRVHQILTGYNSPYCYHCQSKIHKSISKLSVKNMQKLLLKKVQENQKRNPIGKYLKNITVSTGMKNG